MAALTPTCPGGTFLLTKSGRYKGTDQEGRVTCLGSIRFKGVIEPLPSDATFSTLFELQMQIRMACGSPKDLAKARQERDSILRKNGMEITSIATRNICRTPR